MLIPPEYFLFSKLKKRGKTYPHAFYSYVKTYSGAIAEKNIEASRRGFMRAMRELEEEGYLQVEDGHARLIPAKIKANNVDRASLEMLNMMRSTMAYMVHTYAARRTMHFLKQEAASKINRQRGMGKNTPAALTSPHSLLRLKDGMLIHERDWLRDLATRLGFHDYTVKRKKLGDVHATTALYTLAEDGREERLVVKRFASVRAAKWAAMNFWVAGLKKFHVDPTTRLANEYIAIRHFKEIGVNTSSIVAVVPERKLIITRYLEGDNLGDMIESILRNRHDDTAAIAEFGRILCRLHASGCTVGDTKPSNVLVNDDSVYLVDLEQFSFGTDKAWDLVCFIYYSIKFTQNDVAARKIVRAFLDGYMREGGDAAVLKKAMSRKYVPAFYPALVLDVVNAVRDEIKSCIRSYA
jgi:Kae1-associated kinase Bud32